MRDCQARSAFVSVVVASMLVACGDATTSPDAAADAATVDAADGGPILPPALPTLPTLTPCRAGWREVVGEESVTLCEPWPAGGRRDDCAIDEGHFPGTPGCARIGTACPADGWPTGLPLGRNVVYVSAAAAPGGDGRTKATAFTGIGTAADAAPFGSVIAIAAGNYDEGEIYVSPGIALWGACVAGTVIGSTSASPSHAVVFLADNGSEARNLRIESPERLGVFALGTPSTLTDVVVHGARTIGVGTADGVLNVDHVVISGTRNGRGLEIQATASVVLRFVRIDGAVEAAMSVEGASAHLSAEDTAVVGTLARADGIAGNALSAVHGAQVTLSGTVMEDSGDDGIYVADPGTMLVASDLVVRHDTRPASTSGILAITGGAAQVSRALFEDQRGVAFAPQEAGSRITLADVVVRDLHDVPSGGNARGIDVFAAGAAVADRVLIARATDGAVAAYGPGSTVDARDLVVIDTLGSETGDFGRGLVAEDGGAITVERVRIERARDIGVVASHGGALIDAHAITIRDMLGRVSAGDYGIGAWAELTGHVTLTDALVERARLVGVGGIEGGVLTLSHVTVRDTRAAACAATTCMGSPGGFAIAAPYGGVVTATDFVVDGADLCGVVVGETTMHSGGASMDLHQGTITGAPVGACIQVDGYDSARLRDGVQYRAVGIPLQATTYALPGTVASL